MTLRFVSLFAGIGGIDLGLERAGWTCVGQVEIDPFCRAVLAKHWPAVRRWEDVRDVAADDLRGLGIDAIVGGFPCQDISAAGRGAGIDGERSGLWREMHRLVRDVRPRWVLAENVPALRTRGADRVLGDLEATGYACWPLVVGARHVGAPHRRDRVWIVGRLADPGSGRLRGSDAREVQLARGTEALGAGAGLADADGLGLDRQRSGRLLDGERQTRGDDADRRGRAWPARPGQPQHGWEADRVTSIESGLGDATSRVPGQLVGLTGVIHGTLSEAGDTEAVRMVWHPYATEAVQWPAGGHGGLLPPEVLRENLLLREQGDTSAHSGHVAQPGAPRDSIARLVRDVWLAHPAQPTSRQRESSRQPTVECPDALCPLSYAVALDARQVRSLERAARHQRRARLKALGNSVVPAVVEAIGRAILEVAP